MQNLEFNEKSASAGAFDRELNAVGAKMQTECWSQSSSFDRNSMSQLRNKDVSELSISDSWVKQIPNIEPVTIDPDLKKASMNDLKNLNDDDLIILPPLYELPGGCGCPDPDLRSSGKLYPRRRNS